MDRVEIARMADTKCDSTSASDALSRENSLSSLPETECEWPAAGRAWPEPDSVTNAVPTHAALLSTPSPAGTLGRCLPPDGAAPQAARTSFFRVAYQGGVELRSGPFNAPKTGLVLRPGEVFGVIEEVEGNDGIVYLCLSDGLGWVFDDAKLMPHDPSVVRCTYTQPHESGNILWQTRPPALHSRPQSQPHVGPAAEPPLPPAGASLSPLFPPGVELLASTPAQGAPVMMPPPAPVQGSAPLADCIARVPPVSWYRVSHLDGIALRTAPSLNAPLAGTTLPCNETFPVAEEVASPDGRVYLRLCDGQGWALDDSVLMPHDPSVKRGNWVSLQSVGPQLFFTTGIQMGTQAEAQQFRRRRMYPQPRGKRGGKRCSKRKQNAVAARGAAQE